MQEQLRNRLDELKKEFEIGQNRLRELEMQEARLRETILRIDDAIQLAKELLADHKTGDPSQPPSSENK